MEEAVAALAREPDAALLVPPDLSDLYRRSAAYVDRILKGAAPGELPIQAPTGFELVLNLKTAKAMGSKFHDSFCSARTSYRVALVFFTFPSSSTGRTCSGWS